MATFAGVTFAIRWADFSPILQRQLSLTVEHYPDTDTDEIQTGGVGNGRIKLPAIITSTTDLATLRTAMANATVGTLTSAPEGNLSNMMLVDISNQGLAPDNRVIADLEFLETT